MFHVWSIVVYWGYGQTGPYSERGGYDTIASGMAGLMHITGPVVNIPTFLTLKWDDHPVE